MSGSKTITFRESIEVGSIWKNKSEHALGYQILYEVLHINVRMYMFSAVQDSIVYRLVSHDGVDKTGANLISCRDTVSFLNHYTKKEN